LTSDDVAAISRALAEPRRFAMLQQIARESVLLCSALDVQDCISPPTISHHLKELQNAGLITAEREGRATRLALRRDVWDAYLRHLTAL
jgi:ArsR family transcriptional regulator, arsenate/arsenite/antimonite-responsive transcriptional repressor